MRMDWKAYDRQAKTIRKALKSLCPTFSVRQGRGTSADWINITGSAEDEFGHHFTESEEQALKEFGLPFTGNEAGISPESRGYWAKIAEEILGI